MSASCAVGPPWTSITSGSGDVVATGRRRSACTRPPGPSTHTSSTGTDGGAGAPGGDSPTPPASERPPGGVAADDHSSQPPPSGRVVALSTDPSPGPTGVATCEGRST